MKIIDVMQQWNDDCNDSFQMLAGEYFFEQLEYDCSEQNRIWKNSLRLILPSSSVEKMLGWKR